jgi:hypothetical protein
MKPGSIETEQVTLDVPWRRNHKHIEEMAKKHKRKNGQPIGLASIFGTNRTGNGMAEHVVGVVTYFSK